MRQVININEKWAFTKDTDEIPKEMPKGGAGYICLIHGII